jgi:LTXXQ motif family protein
LWEQETYEEIQMNKLLFAALFTAGLASAIPGAVAQTATPQTQAPQAGAAEQGQHAKRPFQLPSERVEARLAYLQTALKITDKQKPQWESFASTMRKQARESDKRVQERRTRMAEHSKRQQLTAIERLERRQQMMAARAQHLNELIAAGKPLYATFTPEQKQVADSLMTSGHGRGGHHRHHGTRGAA